MRDAPSEPPDAPVSPAPPPVSAGSLVAAGVARTRRGADLTLAQVALRSGLSPAYLSQIEAGAANPTLASVDRVAGALRTSVSELFGGEPAETDFAPLVRHRPVMPADGRGGRVWDYAAPGSARLVARLIAGVAGDHAGDVEHAGEEFVMVLAGRYLIRVAGREEILTAGDSCHFPAKRSHRLDPRSADAVALVVISTG